MTRRLVVGSRGSKLAMIQTESVVARLKVTSPHLEISVTEVTTKGDRDRHTDLDRLPGVGIFVKELEEELLAGRIDLAVHSLKDMPTDIPDGLCLVAVPERLDPRDALVADAALLDMPSGSRIGTGSPRRTIQLKEARPDLEIRSIRGNVDTRLRKVAEGKFDGVVLAAAALLRLGCEDRITEYLPVEHFLPSVGQGALVVEARTEDIETIELLAPLNDRTAWRCVTAERTFLKALGGGCRAPIAALATVDGDALRLSGMVSDASGSRIMRASVKGSVSLPEEVGLRLAQDMVKVGANELIDKVTAE